MLRQRSLARNALWLRTTQAQMARPRVLPVLPGRRQESSVAPPPNPAGREDDRKSASFFISNVLPIKLAYWDFRPAIARLREDALMEHLSDIAAEITGHGFRIESWEISRKDGGVFLHFSYIPPSSAASSGESSAEGSSGARDPGEENINKELIAINALPERTYAPASSPGRLFLPQLVESAKKHGGFPSWLGQAWANWTNGQTGDVGRVPGHELYATRLDMVGGAVVKGSGSGMRGIQAMAGDGRVWLVKGRQWTEVRTVYQSTHGKTDTRGQDMNRFPSNRLRVEFDGPDVSQEMLYTLFRVSIPVDNLFQDGSD